MLDACPIPRRASCFGNYGDKRYKKELDKLISYLNALHADHVVLEFAHADIVNWTISKIFVLKWHWFGSSGY